MPMTCLVNFMNDLHYPRIILQTDGEPAIVALAKAIVKERSKEAKDIMTHISLRQSPPGDHASNGLAEATVKRIEGMARTFACDLNKKFGKTIKGDSPIVS